MKGVSVVKLSSLRPAQRSLYQLILDKLKTGDKISLEEATQIWLHSVCRNKSSEGKPLRWDYYADRVVLSDGRIGYTSQLVPMTDDDIVFSVLNWLTRNIGVLVIRGYLKVIPMIEVQP